MKRIKIGGLFIILAIATANFIKPQELAARSTEFKYKSVSYFEFEWANYNYCMFPITECTSEEGKECTLIGSKVRRDPQCLFPRIPFKK